MKERLKETLALAFLVLFTGWTITGTATHYIYAQQQSANQMSQNEVKEIEIKPEYIEISISNESFPTNPEKLNRIENDMIQIEIPVFNTVFASVEQPELEEETYYEETVYSELDYWIDTTYEEAEEQYDSGYYEIETEEPDYIYEESIPEESVYYNNTLDVYQLAWDIYGMDEYTVTGALKLITYEGYWMSSYLDYCCACATIVNWYNKGCGDIYEAFGGLDSSYRYWNFYGVGIADHSINAFREALLDTNWACVEINGMCPENGYYWCHSLDSAWYAEYIYEEGMWCGVWTY